MKYCLPFPLCNIRWYLWYSLLKEKIYNSIPNFCSFFCLSITSKKRSNIHWRKKKPTIPFPNFHILPCTTNYAKEFLEVRYENEYHKHSPCYDTLLTSTTWKMFVFGVYLVCTLSYSDWIQRHRHTAETCGVSLYIHCKCEKIRTRDTLNINTFHADKSSEKRNTEQVTLLSIDQLFWLPSF